MEQHAIQTITLALVIGIFSSVLARRLKVPAVLFYIAGGFAAGPVGFRLIDPASLGAGLLVLVEIAVAIILFEGGLSLSTHSFRAESSAIRRILALTIPLTGMGATVLAHSILRVSWQFAIFFGAVIVVTGPTVIGSLLRSVNLKRRLEILLNWESIWGDVIGVLVSALALKLIALDLGTDSPLNPVMVFTLSLLTGTAMGAISGNLLARYILPAVARLRDPGLPGIVAVAVALATFFFAGTIVQSSGPLAVAVAGFFLSHLQVETLHEIRHFKEQLSTIFISTLFVLLSAFINPLDFMPLWPHMLLIALILGAVVRPFAVLASLAGSTLSLPERIYIGLIGPRGIIAVATMAYATFTVTANREQMILLLNLTFAIIFFSGTMATLLCRPLARFLRVLVPVSSSGLLLVGANPLSDAIARFAGGFVPIGVLDRDTESCSLDDALGTRMVCADLLESDVYEDASEEGFGRILALTGSDSLNELVTRRAAVHLGPQNTFQILASPGGRYIFGSGATDHNIAFSHDFYSSIANEQLQSGEAEVKVLPAAAIMSDRGIVPLLQIVDQGTGVRIVRPGQSVENETLCFVPGPALKTLGRKAS
jgi:NhaP-type Na+/H+ or K+/H+ antiporter